MIITYLSKENVLTNFSEISEDLEMSCLVSRRQEPLVSVLVVVWIEKTQTIAIS